MWEIPFLIFALGLIVGSFLNVCIYRIPLELSIVWPGSACPKCQRPIRAIENVPILSYLALRGKCRGCGQRISLIYPAVELLNGLMYLAVLYRFGLGWHLPVYLALMSSLIVITFIDLEHQIIPDRFTLGGLPIALIAAALVLPDPFLRSQILGWKQALGGAALGFGLFFAIAVLSGGGMGGGDIKLMALVGALAGWKGVLLTTFIGSLVGSVVGGFLIAFKGGGRKTKVPFGPFLALGLLATLFFGQEILRWYFRAQT